MLRALSLSLLAVLLGACQPPTEAPPITAAELAERDSVLALLDGASRATLDDAFARLAARSHTVHERLEQLDERGAVNAFRRRTVAVSGEQAETLFAEAEGTFDFGAFGRFASFEDLDRLPQNPVPFLVQDDPVYLTPQGRDAYAFAFAPDTVLGDRIARVVTVDARPGEADDQAVRRARLYLDPASGALVGLRLDRHSQNVLFGETSRLTLLLAPAPDGTWLPERTHYRVALRAALTATRRFQLRREYETELPATGAVSERRQRG